MAHGNNAREDIFYDTADWTWIPEKILFLLLPADDQ